MGLEGRHVLTTRESLGPDQLIDLLMARGARVSTIPTISLCDPDDWTAFDLAISHMAEIDWFLFTSINAVLQTYKRMAFCGISLPPRIKIATVGKKTAESVRRLGWDVDMVPKDFQAEGLLEGLAIRGVFAKTFFFPRALEAREMLPEGLEELGASVMLVPCYQNKVAFGNKDRMVQCLTDRSPDWITFTSASTAKNFKTILGELPGKMPKIASIGKVTTQALREMGLTPEVQADPQTLDGLVEAMVEAENG